MTKPIKFKKDEVEELAGLRNGYVNIQNQLGQIKVQTILVERQLDALVNTEDELKQSYINLTEQEQALVQKYNEKYGVGTVNIDTGEFIPAEVPETTTDTPETVTGTTL